MEFKNSKIIDKRIPRSPDTCYKNDWVNWSTFLGYKKYESIGERTIKSILDLNNIKFRELYTYLT